MRLTVEERFASKMDRSGGSDACWPWTAGLGTDGYGQFWRNGRSVAAQRAAWELAHGPIPAGMFVCHTCDNPPCVNLAHLFLGTCADNVADMIAKGRGAAQRQTQCINGHPRTVEHSYVHPASGKHKCRTCAREGRRERFGWVARTTKTHCPQGHPYDGANLYVHPGSGRRSCRACTLETKRRWRLAHGAVPRAAVLSS